MAYGLSFLMALTCLTGCGEINRLKISLPSKLVYRKMSYSVQPNASKPATVDKYIFTAVESANYGTATG